MDIARAINSDGEGFVIIIPRSLIAGDPLLLPGTIVFYSGVIRTGTRSAITESRCIDIARAINGNGAGFVSAIPRSIVACDPLFCARGVVLDRGVIRKTRA